ncbi:Glycosyl hydrolase family 57 fused to uncharacterized domain, DUF1957 family [Methylacidiphilum infernorum V4]|uniref:Glycosyl hydrolase family 57 fused to uncharacterized domain, DUF1957 family n=2 Tax=Candidatus Methylacidiphilum infernorum TaxID=511746 RepID=B3DWD0_METI4|nr:Glycosyl hydrolase family 57 fused to uncharacterized domain, DUF1957 family [Methylacidiphilum infernorum V4]
MPSIFGLTRATPWHTESQGRCMKTPLGYLALLLHAHLPFVRHPESQDCLEEDWFFEALTESYIPLLWVFDELSQSAVPFKITLSLSPTLCTMLKDPLLLSRYERYLLKRLELSSREIERNIADPGCCSLAQFYKERFYAVWIAFTQNYKKNLLEAFKKHQKLNNLELITSTATHGYLPLLRNPTQAVKAQIFIALDHFIDCFHTPLKGIWLPECGYYPGIEVLLQEAEIKWFVLEAHGILLANPRPRFGLLTPIYTPSGPAAFGRDSLSSKEVWSAQEGYPADPYYREFYRDLGFDADLDYIKPYVLPTGQRKFTGIKYFRVTGKTDRKELYEPQRAKERTKIHAEDFIQKREKQIIKAAQVLPQSIKPILVCPFDCELFGHWWFEGPLFLKEVIKKAHQSKVLALTTPSEYLSLFPIQQVCRPSFSSWGWGGHSKMWLNETNDFIYPPLHEAAHLLVDLIQQHRAADKIIHRCFRQAARELLLAQASDWPFLISRSTAKEYAISRITTHLNRFFELSWGIRHKKINVKLLEYCECTDNIFPKLNLDYFS